MVQGTVCGSGIVQPVIRTDPLEDFNMDVRRARAILGAGVLTCVPVAASAQPPNNTCASAQPVSVPGLYTAVSVTGTTIGATADMAQSCGLGDNLDVWYSFIAPISGLWYFDTITSILFDTTLAIYSSCGGAQLACNDDIDGANSNFWSAIALTMGAGQSVRIRVSANTADSDVFRLNIVGAQNNANNSCTGADTIVADQPRSGSTLLATTDFVLPAASCGIHPGSGGGRDVFYAYTPTVTQPYRITLCGSNFDTVLAVLTDCSGSASSVVACNDDSAICSDVLKSHLAGVPLTAGFRYLIRIAGFDYVPPDLGTYTLIITPVTMAVCCRGATCSLLPVNLCGPVPGSGGTVFGSGAACNTPGVPNTPCCFANYNKVSGINVQDIFDYLSDWFAGSSLAAVGGNGGTPPTVQHIFDFLAVWFVGGC